MHSVDPPPPGSPRRGIFARQKLSEEARLGIERERQSSMGEHLAPGLVQEPHETVVLPPGRTSLLRSDPIPEAIAARTRHQHGEQAERSELREAYRTGVRLQTPGERVKVRDPLSERRLVFDGLTEQGTAHDRAPVLTNPNEGVCLRVRQTGRFQVRLRERLKAHVLHQSSRDPGGRAHRSAFIPRHAPPCSFRASAVTASMNRVLPCVYASRSSLWREANSSFSC